LTEIINRSLVHIQTSKALEMRHRVGEHELCWPDYRLVCAIAEDVRLPPKEALKRLLLSTSRGSSSWDTRIEDGRLKALQVDRDTLPLSSIPFIEGLVVEILDLQFQESFSGFDLSMFPNLTELLCTDNRLAELDLSHVPKLAKLTCYSNHLTKLDLSHVPNLMELWCFSNHLTELDLSHVPNLTALWCHCNQLTELDLSYVPNLTALLCFGNQLTELNLSHLSNLRELWCWDNHLTKLNLTATPNLTLLKCSDNCLTELDIRNIQNLEDLEYDPAVRLIQRADQDF